MSTPGHRSPSRRPPTARGRGAPGPVTADGTTGRAASVRATGVGAGPTGDLLVVASGLGVSAVPPAPDGTTKAVDVLLEPEVHQPEAHDAQHHREEDREGNHVVLPSSGSPLGHDAGRTKHFPWSGGHWLLLFLRCDAPGGGRSGARGADPAADAWSAGPGALDGRRNRRRAAGIRRPSLSALPAVSPGGQAPCVWPSAPTVPPTASPPSCCGRTCVGPS